MISDPETLHYMFHTSGYDIIKQPERKELSRLLTGRGLIWAEGISFALTCHRHLTSSLEAMYTRGSEKS